MHSKRENNYLRKSIALIVLFSICMISAYAQNYHLFIEAPYKKQTYPEGMSELSQHYSFIGLYKDALMEEEKPGELIGFKNTSNDADLEAKNAYPYIYDAVRKNRIVILNEAHNIPLNRVTFYNIIDSLKKLDVHSVFMEALGYTPTDSIYMNLDINEDLGYYTHENVFRQVMYKLKYSGLRLYSYEVEFNGLDTTTIQGKKYFVSKTDKKWVPIEVDDYLLNNFLSKEDFFNREVEQALKIYQKLKRNNIDKAFIFCGYAHGWRQGNNMIDNLEHLLKEKVVTIDQTTLNERVNKNLENALYTKFATSLYPFVLVDKKQQSLQASSEQFSDLIIGSQKSVSVNNRPTWLELNGDRKRYPLSNYMDGSPYSDFLVCVYTLEELQKKKEEYTPDDVFQVVGNGKEYDLILRPNKNYQLKIIKDKKVIMDKSIQTHE